MHSLWVMIRLSFPSRGITYEPGRLSYSVASTPIEMPAKLPCIYSSKYIIKQNTCTLARALKVSLSPNVEQLWGSGDARKDEEIGADIPGEALTLPSGLMIWSVHYNLAKQFSAPRAFDTFDGLSRASDPSNDHLRGWIR